MEVAYHLFKKDGQTRHHKNSATNHSANAYGNGFEQEIDFVEPIFVDIGKTLRFVVTIVSKKIHKPLI